MHAHATGQVNNKGNGCILLCTKLLIIMLPISLVSYNNMMIKFKQILL